MWIFGFLVNSVILKDHNFEAVVPLDLKNQCLPTMCLRWRKVVEILEGKVRYWVMPVQERLTIFLSC